MRELATRGLWLEQERIVLDPRLPAVLDQVLGDALGEALDDVLDEALEFR